MPSKFDGLGTRRAVGCKRVSCGPSRRFRCAEHPTLHGLAGSPSQTYSQAAEAMAMEITRGCPVFDGSAEGLALLEALAKEDAPYRQC